MQQVLDKLGVDEIFTRPTPKQRVFNHIKDNIPHVANYNYMADLLELPKTRKGFRYLLVMVDLATNKFDIEPMKNKEAQQGMDRAGFQK